MKRSELKKLIREEIQRLSEEEEPFIITQLRDVMKTGYKSIKDPKSRRPIKVDSYSASAIVGVYDKLNPSNKRKLASLSLPRMQSVAFSVINR